MLTLWTPEDKEFWEREGEAIARLNLWISVPALFLSFAIWQVWSVVAVSLPALGFRYSTNQLFWLAAAPALSGATLRIFYSFMVPLVGGRRWTAISTASLLVPALGIGFAVQDSTTAYPTMLALALLCGLGGGNFSSSMANISFFFPKERKGSALGVNAGLGNLGVSVVQFLSPLVITAGVFGVLGGDAQTMVKNGQAQQVWAQNAAFVCVPWIALASLAAWFGMNDIADARASFAAQAAIFRRKHNWIMCVLYLGTFGSFIGFSAGFPLLIKSQFPEVNPLAYAWLRAAGGRADPARGRMAVGQAGRRAGHAVELRGDGPGRAGRAGLPAQGHGWLRARLRAGAGQLRGLLRDVHGAVPDDRHRQRIDLPDDPRDLPEPAPGRSTHGRRRGPRPGHPRGQHRRRRGPGWASRARWAPTAASSSPRATAAPSPRRGPELALWAFAAFYALCIGITWWYYARRHAEMPC